ncbi:alkaline phosphatase family protein [Companilactobacillus suantsaicola]|uniref:Alkaline phosphatase family protein n=1 Tax=Companilactobacillus suantsaicola TaxID=2487723 RepID=A0A4Z0JNG1_9LACO|nr:alkaline phosphatase family protein [Companilactobacillus suantsaicola]TGD23698.1 alkaline phosphatase family protein [Companilactobacillus suantsaicola]
MQKKFNFLGLLQFIFMIAAAFVVGFILNFAQTHDLIFTKQIVFQTNVNTYILTVIILFLIYLGLYGLFNRFFVSSAIYFVFFAIYAVADYLKVKYRSEPILPSDLSMLKNIKGLLSMVTPKIITVVVIFLIILVVIFGLLEKFVGKKMLHFNHITRLIFIALAAISIGSFYTASDNNSMTYKVLAKAGYTNYASNINQSANSNGPMLTFLGNMYVDVMDKPNGYSKEKMASIVKKYQKTAKQINRKRSNNDLSKQTLIFVLSESFSDPSRVPNIKLNQDPIPNIRNIKQNTTSGLMMSSGYGGGTANMEYMTLTGLALNQFSDSLQSPYTQVVNKQEDPINIANSFKTSSAIHPFHGNFYNRNSVYEKFGFKTFKNIDTTGSLKLKYTDVLPQMEYVSDQSAYKDTLEQVNSVNGGQFINLVTMQNHMPYTNNYTNNPYKVTGSGVSDSSRSQVENFSQSLNYTDNSTKEFLEELDKLDKPVTVVWYGDHLPGIYDGDDIYKYNVQEHQTDYFIYSNKYARKNGTGTTKLDDNTKVTDPNGFIPLALKQMDQKVTPYYALLTKVQEEVPAMAKNIDEGTNNLYVNEDGKSVDKLTKQQQKIVDDYKLVQYDLTAGKGYTKAVINK